MNKPIPKFKVGDKVKIKYYKNKEEYDKYDKNLGWSYNTHRDCYEHYKNSLLIINFISEVSYVSYGILYRYYVDHKDFHILWEHQIEKVISLLDKLDKLEELL